MKRLLRQEQDTAERAIASGAWEDAANSISKAEPSQHPFAAAQSGSDGSLINPSTTPFAADGPGGGGQRDRWPA